MSAWGASIFSDDTACDIRDEFRMLAGDGLSPEAATQKLVEDYESTLKDPDEGPVFWLALAAVQSRTGRLLEAVRQKALHVIDAGLDLPRWQDEDDAKLLRQRVRVLEKLRAELVGPQRSPVKLRKVFRNQTDWRVGHALSYRLPSGRLAIFRILAINESWTGDRTPMAEVCDWCGTDLPERKAIERLPHRSARNEEASWLSAKWARKYGSVFALCAAGPRDTPGDRIAVIATGLKVRPSDGCGTHFGGWKRLDDYLLRDYRLK